MHNNEDRVGIIKKLDPVLVEHKYQGELHITNSHLPLFSMQQVLKVE